MCAPYFTDSLGGNAGAGGVELQMIFGQHFQWGKNFDKLVCVCVVCVNESVASDEQAMNTQLTSC